MSKILELPKVGLVVDNNDPETYGRIKVSIPDLTDKIPVEDLPWYPVIQNSQNNNQMKIPEIGSWVIIEFPDLSIYNGLVKGILPAKPQS